MEKELEKEKAERECREKEEEEERRLREQEEEEMKAGEEKYNAILKLAAKDEALLKGNEEWEKLQKAKIDQNKLAQSGGSTKPKKQ